MNPFNFKNKVVLVVGGSSGIGNAIARSFLDHGAVVRVWGTRSCAEDYDIEDGSDLSGIEYSQVDVTNDDEISAQALMLPRLDILVLSQGAVVYQRGEFQRGGWDKVISVNLDSVFVCSSVFKERLSEANGSLIIISSISGFQANIGNPAYSASKAGTISLTRTLAKAWARDGIRVNGIAPGFVDTKLTKATTGNSKRLEAIIASIPVGHLGLPNDMAQAALFLSSPLASYIVGHTLVVDGGVTLS